MSRTVSPSRQIRDRQTRSNWPRMTGPAGKSPAHRQLLIRRFWVRFLASGALGRRRSGVFSAFRDIVRLTSAAPCRLDAVASIGTALTPACRPEQASRPVGAPPRGIPPRGNDGIRASAPSRRGLSSGVMFGERSLRDVGPRPQRSARPSGARRRKRLRRGDLGPERCRRADRPAAWQLR
jgi:hypothetical protein